MKVEVETPYPWMSKVLITLVWIGLMVITISFISLFAFFAVSIWTVNG